MTKEVIIASAIFLATMGIMKEFTLAYASSINSNVGSFEAKWVKAP